MAIRLIPEPGVAASHPGLLNLSWPVALEWCQGHGIELGASAHNGYGLPGSLNVAPWSDDPAHPDRQDFDFYRRHSAELCGHYAAVDVIGCAERIPVPGGSLDYVLSSHVIEHSANVLAAFVEWHRVLRPGGIAAMIFPKRDALEADAVRDVTPLSHFVHDWETGATVESHPLEPGHGWRGHFHVFTLASMLELIEWANAHLFLGWETVYTEETDSKVGNGHAVIARKGGS